MSSLGKGLLASAVALPLVAFVAGVLAAPAPVDPDRSRPVIIGRVSEDAPPATPTPTSSSPDRRQGTDGDDDRSDDPDDVPTEDAPTNPPGTAVTPQPRYMDGDDGDRDDDGDDDTDDGGESRDD